MRLHGLLVCPRRAFLTPAHPEVRNHRPPSPIVHDLSDREHQHGNDETPHDLRALGGIRRPRRRAAPTSAIRATRRSRSCASPSPSRRSLFGLDKFFNILVDWPIYLAPWINDIAPGSGQDFMYFVGVIEIAAGVLVAREAALRRLRRGGVARRHHRQPAHLLRLLRHRAARLRAAARRPDAGAGWRPCTTRRCAGAGTETRSGGPVADRPANGALTGARRRRCRSARGSARRARAAALRAQLEQAVEVPALVLGDAKREELVEPAAPKLFEAPAHDGLELGGQILHVHGSSHAPRRFSRLLGVLGRRAGGQVPQHVGLASRAAPRPARRSTCTGRRRPPTPTASGRARSRRSAPSAPAPRRVASPMRRMVPSSRR